MSSPAGLPTWLFVSYGGGHVKALLPVAQRVQALGIARPLYLALTTAAGAVRAAGISTVGFRDFVDPTDGAALAAGERLVQHLEVQAADRAESIAYLGLSYQDLARREGEAAAAEAYASYGRQAFLPLNVLERVLDRVRPELVVTTNSPRAERAAIFMARARGVPAACLVDLFGLWERDVLVRPDYADAVCVLNDAVRRSLVEAGRPAADVHLTGNPAFDSVNDPEVVAAGQAIRREAGWDGLHVCLYASTPEPRRVAGVDGEGDPEWPRRIEAALLACVEANPRLALWVRRHPSEATPENIAAAGHPRIRVAGPEGALHGWIHASDEVIVTISTVGVEAHLAGKCVTQVRGSLLDHLGPYVQMGLAQRAVGLGELAAVYGKGVPALPGQPAEASAGRAVDRVVAVLQSLRAKRGA